MKVELIFLVALNFSYSQGLPNKRDNCMELIEKSGYSGQTHEVETEDGYILTVHRVLSNNNTVNNGPVFLMHGLLATAADFVITGPKIALAYLLSDNGYDVWMGNARGSKYSTAHRKHRIDSREFWNFSWHEIGFYDVPAMVDYVLNVTEASSTFYIGHSQGTTALIVMLSEHSEYNKKITQAHLMSPSAFETNLPHPMVRVFGQQIAVKLVDKVFFCLQLSLFLITQEMIEDYRLLNFSPIFDVGNELSEVFCTESLGLTLCEAIIFAIVGNNRDKVEIDTVSFFFCGVQNKKVFVCYSINCCNLFFIENYTITDKAHFQQIECYANYSLPTIDGKWKISAI